MNEKKKRLVLDFKSILHDNKRTAAISIAIVLFISILKNIHDGDIQKLDAMAYWLAVEKLRNPFLTPIMEGFSYLASPVVLLAMLVIISAFAPGKSPAKCATINLVSIVVINQLLKNIVQRPRPEGYRLVSEIGYSFPSGHSMVAAAFYGFLAWLAWHYEKEKASQIIYFVVFGLLAIMVGFSRIYLGVHYASDVLGGFCISVAWLAFFTSVIAPLYLPNIKRKE